MQRGEVYHCLFGTENILGSEQRGNRPVVIIQSDEGNEKSSTVIVALMTSQPKKKLPMHVELRNYKSLKEHNIVLTEQIRTVDKRRLIEYRGKLTPEDLLKVDMALVTTSLGININNLIKEKQYD